MGVGYEVPLGCLCVAGEEFEILHFSTAPTSLLTELRVWGERLHENPVLHIEMPFPCISTETNMITLLVYLYQK